MKCVHVILSSALFGFTELASAQGFVNLDFESAQIIPLTQGAQFPPFSLATTDAVPGWNVFYGASQQSQITYNDPSLGATAVNLNATNRTQISGNYSVSLQGGLTASAATISQIGLVPGSAESLFFEAQQGGNGTLQVSLGGQNLSIFALSSGANYTLYGADISGFAGHTENLAFSAIGIVDFPNNWNIDNIQFSSSPIPEPSTFAFFGLGAGMLAFRRWRKSAR